MLKAEIEGKGGEQVEGSAAVAPQEQESQESAVGVPRSPFAGRHTGR